MGRHAAQRKQQKLRCSTGMLQGHPSNACGKQGAQLMSGQQTPHLCTCKHQQVTQAAQTAGEAGGQPGRLQQLLLMPVPARPAQNRHT